MNELVFKVAEAMMRDSHRRNWPLGQLTDSGIAFELQRSGSPWPIEARAAIKAVAEWLKDGRAEWQGDYLAGSILLAQLEDRK